MRSYDDIVPFPYGLSNFRDIILEGYYYVDKTFYVEQLEKSREKFISFLRPRRIGKSLFVSVLEYYYDKQYADQFQEIFSKVYIGKNPTPLANQFAVLKMDFSGIDTTTEERAYDGFLGKIRVYIGVFNRYYKCFEQKILDIIQSQSSPELTLKKFFEFYQGDQIYIIIDEYDHFTNEILIQDLRQFKKAVSKNGYVRKFYEVIKEATQQGTVNRIFITGVSPITLDSLTSGFNMITHLTGEPSFHDMMGFTESEVSHIVDLILDDSSKKEQIMHDMRDWYNGYRFHLNNQERIYNSDMVLFFSKYYQRYQDYPRQMLDPNIAPDHGKLQKMFEIQDADGNYAILERIIQQQKIQGEIVIQFSLERGFSDNEFISFLFYMGYLTIAGEENLEVVFQIPNYVIKELYWEYFAWLITERENLPYNSDKIRDGVRSMLRGNIYPFMEMVKDVLNILSNRDYQNFDEKYIKMLIIAYIIQTNTYYTPSERETPAGYIDLLFIAPTDRKVDYEYIFELKYLKKKDASDQAIATAKAEAKSQILNYLKTDPLLHHRKSLYAYTLVFVKDQLLIDEVELLKPKNY